MNKDIKWTVLISVIIFSVSMIIAFSVFQLERKSDYIAVTGQSELAVAPDQAVLYFTVYTLRDTAKEAQEENSRLTSKIQQALANDGIDPSRIETANYYLNKQTDWTQDGPIDRGYALTHSIKVTTSNLQDVGKIIETAVNAGANGVERISFELSQESKNKASTEVMREATAAAKDKAAKVALATGRNTGRVLKIEESSWWFQSPYDYYTGMNQMGGGSSNFIAPQKIAIAANVNVVYELK